MNPLQTFSTGDTDYIAKHNANYAAVKAAIDALEAQLSGTATGAASLPALFFALFGPQTAVIGVGSYACSGSGSTLTVQAGHAWLAGSQTVVRKSTSTTISFSGLSAATYYITVGGTGTPVRSTSATDALYSVVWTGSAFGTITRLAAIAWAFDDWDRAKTSTALGTSYDRLDDRLEAGETKAVAGDLARTWLTGRLAKDVSGSSDVTLTATEANNAVLDLSGTLTGNINLILPTSGPRAWVVRNGTSGAYTLTVKTASGTGITVPQGASAGLFCDGTNIRQATTSAMINHANLSGLTSTDDHPQYVHTATSRTITAQHSFSPLSAAAPFTLGANAQGQLVTGLNADQLDGYEATAFPLLSGRAGGQTLTGGPGASDDLTLSSTRHVVLSPGSGNVGLGVASPSIALALPGNAAKTIGAERNTESGGAGQTFTVRAGGATAGETNKAGGDLILASGYATGSGSADIQFQATPAGSSGTSDRTPTTFMWLKGTRELILQTNIGFSCKRSGAVSASGQAVGIYNFVTNNGTTQAAIVGVTEGTDDTTPNVGLALRTGGSTSNKLWLSYNGNLGLGVTAGGFGTSAVRVFAIAAGTAPTSSPADIVQMWAADQVAGNCTLKLRTENGAVLTLYQESAIANPSGGSTVDTEARTAIGAILTALRNIGFIAAS